METICETILPHGNIYYVGAILIIIKVSAIHFSQPEMKAVSLRRFHQNEHNQSRYT